MTNSRELNTAPVNALITESLRAAFDRWASDRGLSRSAAVKLLITNVVNEDGYGALSDPLPAQIDSADPTCPDGDFHSYRGHAERDDARGDVIVWTCRRCGAERPPADVSGE